MVFSGVVNCNRCILKQWIVFFARSIRLLNQYPTLFTDSPPVPPSEQHQTRVSYKQNCFPVCCRIKQRNFTNNQASCSRNTRSSVWKFYQVKLCLFDLKPVKKFFVYKWQLSLLVKGVVIHSVKRLLNLVLSLFMNKSTK